MTALVIFDGERHVVSLAGPNPEPVDVLLPSACEVARQETRRWADELCSALLTLRCLACGGGRFWPPGPHAPVFRCADCHAQVPLGENFAGDRAGRLPHFRYTGLAE